jgi:predicted murein hydrolase (TIGR00659 family)
MSDFFTTPLFGICLSLSAYVLCSFLYSKKRIALLNPLFTSVIVCIAFLLITGTPLSSYSNGGQLISLFLSPATACLAVAMYDQLPLLKKYTIPVICGTIVGAATAMGSVLLMCKLFGLDQEMLLSLLPKSVTTPFAIAVSESLGGNPSISVAAVVLTGILGATLSPILIRIFGIKESLAAGIGIGTSSHAGGTSKALELGETEGAASGTAIGLTGIVTVLLSLLFQNFI